jgi:hypothetical protein
MNQQAIAPTTKLTEAQQELVGVNDRIIFALWFTSAGLMMGLASLAGGTWAWYTAAALLLVLACIDVTLGSQTLANLRNLKA